MTIESHAGDAAAGATPAEDHSELVESVRAKFFGQDEETARDYRASIAALITGEGRLEVDPRYIPIGEPSQERNGDRFKTVLRLRAGVFQPVPS